MTIYILTVGFVGEDGGLPTNTAGFLSLGYVKDKVYAIPVRNLRDLRNRIIEGIESIPEDMLHAYNYTAYVGWQGSGNRLPGYRTIECDVTAQAHQHHPSR